MDGGSLPPPTVQKNQVSLLERCHAALLLLLEADSVIDLPLKCQQSFDVGGEDAWFYSIQ